MKVPGVLRAKDIYNAKWITAEITDASHRIHYVPIKHTLGDYFVAEINKDLYVFRIDGSRIKTYRETLVKSFRVLQYDTSHYLPVSQHLKELELVVKKNSLPKMNTMMFNILKYLGRQEKEGLFTPHKFPELIAKISEKEDDYAEQARSIKSYLENLKVDEIITPVRSVTDFIEGDLKATDPKFLGTIVSHFQRTDIEHKKITNTPIGPKTAWLKWVAVFALIGLVLAVIYILYEQGTFDDIGGMFGGLGNIEFPNIGGGIAAPSSSFMERYPTPEAAKAALDRGEITEKDIPPEMRELVKKVETPKVEL